MSWFGNGKKGKEQEDEGITVYIEHQDGRLEELHRCVMRVGLIVHEETHQTFPPADKVPRFKLSLDGDYAEFDVDVHYYDDEFDQPEQNGDYV